VLSSKERANFGPRIDNKDDRSARSRKIRRVVQNVADCGWRCLPRSAKAPKLKHLDGSIMVPTKSAAEVIGALRRAPRATGRALIRLYRFGIAPLIGMNCRHLPTCSDYADEALARYGLWGGGWMTLARLARCHPWGTSGFDPVPAEVPAKARWWQPWRYGQWTGAHIDPKTRLDR
jgi:putative membrane protein insertion efficiency factor